MSYSFDTLGEDDVLTRSTFHKLLVAFDRPSTWPRAIVGLTILTLALLAGGAWWLFSDQTRLGVAVVLMQLVFFAADLVMLSILPRRRISFARAQAQFFALALPRTAATAAVVVIGVVFGWTIALVSALAVQLLGSVALYRGAFVEPATLHLTRLPIAVDSVPPGSAPVRLLHVSDIHLERWSVRETQLLAHIAAQAPDVILITGDYVNLSFQLDRETHRQLRDLLGRLSAPLGVFAVLGSPPVDLHTVVPGLFEDSSVTLLRNETCTIEAGGGVRLTLVGLDCHHDIERDRATLATVLAKAPADTLRVLMYHSPELMPDAAALGVDLYLCGHTHGGQVRLPFIGPLLTMSALGRRYSMGHYRDRCTNLYISRGIGFEGLGAPRVRLFSPPEVTLITLHPAATQ